MPIVVATSTTMFCLGNLGFIFSWSQEINQMSNEAQTNLLSPSVTSGLLVTTGHFAGCVSSFPGLPLQRHRHFIK